VLACYVQTNTDEASRTSLALQAAESAKGQRQDRSSLESAESTGDSVRTTVRSPYSASSSSPGAVSSEITKVSSLLVYSSDF